MRQVRPAPKPAAPTGGAKVYVVDDDPAAQAMARSALSQVGMAIDVFPSAEEALDAVRAAPPEAVVLDIVLPGAHGLVALRQILQDRPETSVVVASRLNNPDVVAEAIRCGAASFLTKPVPFHDFVAAVRHAVDWTRLKRRIHEIEARLERQHPGQRDAVAAAPALPEHRAPIVLDLQTVERRAIENALRVTSGNVSEAARRLGIGRTTLYRKMVAYGLEKAA